MKIAIIFFAFIGMNATADSLFSINEDRSIKLDLAIEQALVAKLPGVKALTYSEFSDDVQTLFHGMSGVSPIAFSSDFNGDGKTDLALVAGDKDKVFALALISKNKVYEVLVLDQWPRNKTNDEAGEITYISKLPSEKVHVKKGVKRKAQDVIQVETYLGAVQAFFIKDFKALPYRGEFW